MLSLVHETCSNADISSCLNYLTKEDENSESYTDFIQSFSMIIAGYTEYWILNMRADMLMII